MIGRALVILFLKLAVVVFKDFPPFGKYFLETEIYQAIYSKIVYFK
jgi:hypothetical protein